MKKLSENRFPSQVQLVSQSPLRPALIAQLVPAWKAVCVERGRQLCGFNGNAAARAVKNRKTAALTAPASKAPFEGDGVLDAMTETWIPTAGWLALRKVESGIRGHRLSPYLMTW